MTPSPSQVVYFGQMPNQGAGSAIIAYRHLRRLANDGWRVGVVSEWGQDQTLCRSHGWQVLTLTHRRWYWPPLTERAGILRTWRMRLWAGEAFRVLGLSAGGAVLTYVSAFSNLLSEVAAAYARRCRVPLVSLVHDDARLFASSSDEAERAHASRQAVLDQSSSVWFASEELASCYNVSPSRRGILPPIPEGVTNGSTAVERRDGLRTVVYAGGYWEPQIEAFREMAPSITAGGGRLLAVIKAKPEHVEVLRGAGIAHREPFARNEDALAFYRSAASAMLVSYSRTSSEMPWIRSSFPSKLIEYCHLGVPIVIVSPADSAVSRWAASRGFPDCFAPEQTSRLREFVAQLGDPGFQQDRLARLSRLAETEFSPARIHDALMRSLRNEPCTV